MARKLATRPANPAKSSLATGVKPCVGVLFVHGAGDHGVGATLIEFGEPLVGWLDGWLSKGQQAATSAGDKARAGAAQILVREADPSAPAHSAVTLRPQRDDRKHVWLLAEARWDEAFTPPAFRQVLLWALSVVPWTVLTQFIGPVIDESQLLRRDLGQIVRFFWNIAASIFLALIVAVILQTVALAILVLSIIPLDPVREVVGKLQRFASTSVGDLYMVLMSPIQRAALTSAVQRDIDWLRGQGCDRIVVIAHSQGGYVAYQALADPWFRPVESFITFGSGLIRLTESEQAKRNGWLIWALVGTVGALLALRFSIDGILGTLEFTPKQQVGAFAFALGLLMSIGLIVAILRYRGERQRVADLPVPIPWFDYLTHEDPVLNGRPGPRLPTHVKTIWVQNHASVVADHGSYWKNSDQFVAQVAAKVGNLDPDLDLLNAGPTPDGGVGAHLRRSRARRHARIAALKSVRLPIAIATAALLAIRSDQLATVGNQVAGLFTWFPSVVVSWLPDVVESVIPIAVAHVAYVGAAVIVGLSLLAYRIGVSLWEAWGQDDLHHQWAGQPPNEMSSQAVAFYAWSILHVAVIAVVTVVGPATVIRFLEDIWANRGAILQAWAHQYPWSIGIAGAVLVAGLILTSTWSSLPERRSRRPIYEWIVGATAIALAVELIVALLRPGELPADVAIPMGLVGEVVALIGVLAVRPIAAPTFRAITSGLERFTRGAERFTRGVGDFTSGAERFVKVRTRRMDPVATNLDRAGVLGFLLIFIAAFLTFQAAPITMLVGAILALVAAGSTGLMATNTNGRTIPLLGRSEPTPEGLRLAGWVGAIAGTALFAIELARLLFELWRNGMPP
jgi:hypothetical protein